MSVNKVVGVVVLVRHGDRSGFFQDPTTYTASDTSITALGTVQEHDLGSLLRSIYLNQSSPLVIDGINQDLVNTKQIKVRADTGDEGGVIFDSSIALLQGLYPPTSLQNSTLADGSVVVSPLGGYQYVPIESVEANEDVSLEGHASCTAWSSRVANIYTSPAFTAVANETATKDFFSAIQGVVGSERTLSLSNAYNIFDFINVQSIHNGIFNKELDESWLPKARDLASFHEWITFTDTTPGGIGNIDGQTILPSILGALNDIANSSNPLKLHYSAISYKPFISLVNMTADPSHPVGYQDLGGGLTSYASALILEVFANNSIQLKYRNGTSDTDFHVLALNSSLNTVSGFTHSLEPFAINNTLAWCNACQNKVDRGCAALFSGSASSGSQSNAHYGSTHRAPGQSVSPLAAGFIGAVVTLVVALLVGGLFGYMIGGRSRRSISSDAGDSQMKAK